MTFIYLYNILFYFIELLNFVFLILYISVLLCFFLKAKIQRHH